VQLSKIKNGFRLLLSGMERMVLEEILKSLSLLYLKAPDELDERIRRQWYDIEGLLVSGYEHEREYWLGHLQSMRSERIGLISAWIGIMEKFPPGSPAVWDVPEDQVESLLMVFNDHRLYLAAWADIQEEDMHMEFTKLPEGPKKESLLMIHFMEAVQEWIIRAISEDED